MTTLGVPGTVPAVSSPEQQFLLACAVSAQRRARLLTPDNTASDPLPLAEAVASRRSYFVVPRNDLLVIDADLPEDPDAAAARAAAFDQLIESAHQCGVPHVVVASGRPGHRHGYLLMGTDRSRAMVEQWCRTRGLDVRDRGVRPPGSPHRDGRRVAAAIVPSDPAAVVTVLSAPVDREAARRLGRRLLPIELPARIRAALRHGHAAAGYESPSHARMALAVAVRSRSGPRALLEMLLGDHWSPLGATFRSRNGRWQQQELRRLWDKASDWLAQRPSVGKAVHEVDLWARAIASHRWSGMSGGTDLAVAEALHALAERVGTTAVGYALADLAVAAGIGLDTARASVRRLLATGWLAVVAEATPRTSRVYRLVIPTGKALTPAPGPGTAGAGAGRTGGAATERLGAPSGVGAALADLGGDLARWRALGKVTVRVARTLAETGPATVQVLAQQLQMAAASVRHHLRKLARNDLVGRVGGAWALTMTEQDVEDLEVDFGVAGRREFERNHLQEQRAQRAALLAQYRTAWLSGRRAGRFGRAPNNTRSNA